MVQYLQATGGVLSGAPKSTNRRVLEPKGVSRVDAYTGKDGSWREWSFQFRVAVKAIEAEVAKILSKVERDDTAHVLEDLELEYEKIDVAKTADCTMYCAYVSKEIP